ncbi:hypothetical protein D3C71_2245040 [compost metagenome]
MSKLKPASLSSLPDWRAWAAPVSVRSTSTQPVKRFSRFQVDSPWRMRTSLYMLLLPESR